MSYEADGIVIEPELLTSMELAVFDSSSHSIYFTKGYDFWRVRGPSWPSSWSIRPSVDRPIDNIAILFDGTIITRNYLQLFAVNEHQRSYHEAIDRVTSLLFSPDGEQLAVMGMTNTTLFNVSDAGMSRDSQLNSTEVAAFTAEGTRIDFEYNLHFAGLGMSRRLLNVAEVWPDGKWLEWYADPAQRDDFHRWPFEFDRPPFLSPDVRHAIVPYQDTLLDAQCISSISPRMSFRDSKTHSLAAFFSCRSRTK